ncbi:PAS domain S-box protein [Ktedonospora formicarum]
MLKTRHITRLTPESHETLLTILETLPGALFVLDDASIIIYANASAQALLGTTPETLVGNSFWGCAPQLVSTALYQAIQKTKQTRALTDVQYVSSVTQRWLHVHLSSTSGGLTLQFHEMGAPAERQEIAHQRESFYMEVLENVHAGIVFLTPEGIILDLNEVPLDDAQIRREEVVGKPLVEGPWWSFSPPSQAQIRAAIARASRGETVRFETPIYPREGMELHLEAAITPHRGADHHVDYLIMAGIDITARKHAEEKLHTLIDAIPQLVWTGRPDGYVDFYNQRWRDYTGLSTEEAQGEGWMQCTHPEDRKRVLEAWQNAVQTGTPYETEQRLRQSTTGNYRWFLMQATPYTDAQGTILKYIGTCTDIHDKKRIEAELSVLIDTIPQLVWMLGPMARVNTATSAGVTIPVCPLNNTRGTAGSRSSTLTILSTH